MRRRIDRHSGMMRWIARSLLVTVWAGSASGFTEERSVRPDLGSPSGHWAYSSPTRPPFPSANDAAWARNPIDAFVRSRLEQEGVRPAPPADASRLVRRLYLDLTGLPPTPAAVDAFLADLRPDAYERLVDRLLASPAYGERWAVPWLDLARYADSNGFQRDGHRSIWAYRDWVVDALNGDMPFDRFTIEQMAGDLLPEATVRQKVATGFHRCTTVNVEAGVDEEENRVLAVIDRVNSTSTVWLGTTLECAQCHDHKYDPFSQKEYYQLFAFFNNTAMETESNGPSTRQFTGPSISLPEPVERIQQREQLQAEHEALRESLRTAQDEVSAQRKTAKKEGSDATSQETQQRVAELKKRVKKLKQRLDRMAPWTSLVMVEQEPRSTRVFERGNFLLPREEVRSDTPAVLHDFPEDSPRSRLGLARWLVSPENPLVARVTVNRWWAEFFGRGLVESVEDFGTQSRPPIYRELLDWLAVDLVEGGWSVKDVHRQLVTSTTYRQSSRTTQEARERDPYNRLYARASRLRLSAEGVRDNALASAGLLSMRMHGPPVFPEQPDGVWSVTGVVDNTYRTSHGADRYRRSLYTVWRRSSPYPAFTNFDAPDRAATCVQRSRTNTPLQALTLLNDPVYVRAAVALADRVLSECPTASLSERLRFAFRLCLARSPSNAELDVLIKSFAAEFEAFQVDMSRARSFLEAYQPVEKPQTHRESVRLAHLDSIKTQRYSYAIRDSGSAIGGASVVAEAESGAGESKPGEEALCYRAALSVLAGVLLNLDETITRA